MSSKKVYVGLGLLALLSAAGVVPLLAAPPAFDAEVGDIYLVSTIKGYARTLIDGEPVRVRASVQLTVLVTEVHGDLIAFRVTAGSIVINGTRYLIEEDWERGVYNKRTRSATYEGWGTDPGGRRVYFILHSMDKRRSWSGVLMKMTGAFKDPEGANWELDLKTLRSKLSGS
mgnify:CR=1 FL=1